MFSKWRHRPSLQSLISRKPQKRIIAKSRLMTIAIQVAAFGLIKRSLTFNNDTSWHECHEVLLLNTDSADFTDILAQGEASV